MPDVMVPVTWVKQETAYFCGPAVAQMSVSSLGTAQPPAPPSWQQQLWTDIQAETNSNRPAAAGPGTPTCPAFPTQKCVKYLGQWHCWSTTPEALERVLNLRQTGATYAVSEHLFEVGATEVLLDAIDAGLPGVALVYGWQHWLVMDGYANYDLGPTVTIGGRVIDGVLLRDSNDEPSLHYVAWKIWRDEYLSAVPYGYDDKIVVIGGVPRPTAPPAPAPPTGVQISGAAKMARMAQRVPDFISPEAAVLRAQAVVEKLLKQDRWQIALVSSAAGEPLRVQRLDRDDSYYYIVPFRIDRRDTARVLVDAHSGEFTNAAGIETRDAALAPYVDPVVEMQKWYGRRLDLPAVGTRVIRPDTVGYHPVLVWKPCQQSTSPLLPFYEMSVGDRLVYLTADGRQWFDELTTGPA